MKRDLSNPLASTFGEPKKKRTVVKSVDSQGNKKKVVTRRNGTKVTKTERDGGSLGVRKSKRVTKADGTSKSKSTVTKGSSTIKSKTSSNADGSVVKRKSVAKDGFGTKTKNKSITKSDGSSKTKYATNSKTPGKTYVQKRKTNAAGKTVEKTKESRLGKNKAKNTYKR
jgi:hypothetical protein